MYHEFYAPGSNLEAVVQPLTRQVDDGVRAAGWPEPDWTPLGLVRAWAGTLRPRAGGLVSTHGEMTGRSYFFF